MKHLSILVPVLVMVSFLAGLAGWNGVIYAGSEPKASGSTVPTRYIVQFKPGTSEERMLQICREAGAAVETSIPQINAHVVEAFDDKAISEFSEVALIEPDHIATVGKTPDDTDFNQQWGLNKIQALQAWEATYSDSSIKIAILDSGIDSSHPDLSSKIVAENNFTDSPSLADVYGHGTHVAGIAAAVTNNSAGIAGVACEASLMNVKVLGDDGFGPYSWIAQGIIWAADNGANVINMSMGGHIGSAALEQAINYAWEKGVVVAVAAGNNGSSEPSYPAFYEKVIAVAATDPDDCLCPFSNYGDWVDVAAPGSTISTLPGDKYGVMNGTSIAAPFVSGLAGLALAVAVDVDENGKTNDEVRSAIQNGCDGSGISGIGSGRINAFNTISELVSKLPVVPDPIPDLKPVPSPVLPPSPKYKSFGLGSGDSDWNQRANILNVMRYRNTAGTGILTWLGILFNDSTPSGKVRLMVYADKCGKPEKLMLDAGESTAADGWVHRSDLRLPVVENHYYWLGFIMQDENTVRYQSGLAANSHCRVSRSCWTAPASFPNCGIKMNSTPYVMRAKVRLDRPASLPVTDSCQTSLPASHLKD